MVQSLFDFLTLQPGPTWGQMPSLGACDQGRLEEGMATHSSILAWRIPAVEEPGRLQSTGAQELDTTEQPNTAQDKCLRSVEFSPPEYKARDDTHANVSISWVPSKYTHIHTHAHTYLRAVKHNIHTHTHSYTHDLRCSLFLSSSLNT